MSKRVVIRSFGVALCLMMVLPLAAFGADKLVVRDAGGVNPVFVVQDDGGFNSGPLTSASATKGYISTNLSESLLIVEADGQNAGLFGRAYGTGKFPFFSGRAARGTFASPSASITNNILMRFGGAGYGTTGFAGSNRASLDFAAAENWSDTAQGTYITISTTANTTTTMTERVRINDNGTVKVTNLAGTYTNGSAYVCVDNAGLLYTSETGCP